MTVCFFCSEAVNEFATRSTKKQKQVTAWGVQRLDLKARALVAVAIAEDSSAIVIYKRADHGCSRSCHCWNLKHTTTLPHGASSPFFGMKAEFHIFDL